MRRKSNNKFVVVEYREGKWEYSTDFDNKEDALLDMAAREDMGL